jgi:hypothetical protein
MRSSANAGPTEQDVRRVRTDLVNESIYGRLASHSAVHYDGGSQWAVIGRVAGKAVFGKWLPHWDESLGGILGICSEQAALLRGQDLRGIDRIAGIELACHLRFCVTCMQEGYHPIVFQHYTVTHCARHRTPLAQACPSCERRILPTVDNVRAFPFMCPVCGAFLSTLHSQRRAAFDARAHDATLSQLRSTLASATRKAADFYKVDEELAHGLAPMALARHVHRTLFLDHKQSAHASWSYRIEHIAAPFEPESALAPWQPQDAGQLVPLLRWLSTHCPGAEDACMLAARPGLKSSGWRHDADVSATGAMLCKVLRHYSLLDEFVDLHVHGHTRLTDKSAQRFMVRHCSSPVFSPAASRRMLHLEILGLLAALLATCKPGRPLIAVDFGAIPPALTWAPRYTVRGTSAHDRTVRIIARADENSLLRLFRRYGNKRFVLAPATEEGLIVRPQGQDPSF